MSQDSAPEERPGAAAAWTGTEMLVWGGSVLECCENGGPVPYGDGGVPLCDTCYGWLLDGGRYDPVADAWTLFGAQGAPDLADRQDDYVWTGAELIAFGTSSMDTCADLPVGARFEEATSTWRPMSFAGAPNMCRLGSAVWTGVEMAVVGANLTDDAWAGGLYDPATNSWRAMSFEGAPEFRWSPSAVWTGSEMIVWGGSLTIDIEPYHLLFNTGGRYTP